MFKGKRKPEQPVGSDIDWFVIPIARAAALIGRASGSGGRPGAQLAQARDFLQGARDSFGKKSYGEAFRLAVESQSYARRAMRGAAADESGDASFIFIEGDVSLQT